MSFHSEIVTNQHLQKPAFYLFIILCVSVCFWPDNDSCVGLGIR